MCHNFKRSRKCLRPRFTFLEFTLYIQVVTPVTPVQAWKKYFLEGRMVNLLWWNRTSGGRIFIERINPPLFLEMALLGKTIQQTQSNLQDKGNSSVFKRWIFIKDKSIHFHIDSVTVISRIKLIWVFPSSKWCHRFPQRFAFLKNTSVNRMFLPRLPFQG